jgi:hypothetical protein
LMSNRGTFAGLLLIVEKSVDINKAIRLAQGAWWSVLNWYGIGLMGSGRSHILVALFLLAKGRKLVLSTTINWMKTGCSILSNQVVHVYCLSCGKLHAWGIVNFSVMINMLISD